MIYSEYVENYLTQDDALFVAQKAAEKDAHIGEFL